MKKLSLLFLTVMLGMGVFAQTTYSWRSEATNGNWNDANNWWTNTTAVPTGGDILSFGNDNQLTMTNDLSATNRYQIIFTSYAKQSRKITGTTENIFNKNGSNKPKIENNSSANQTIDFPLKWGNSVMELKPVSGDLTITSIINNNGYWTDVGSGNGKTLSIASMFGTGGLSIISNQTTVKITGTSTYTGITYVNYGTLELQADLSSAEIIVANGAKLVINGTDVDIQTLTINSGGTVEVKAGMSLSINGNLVNNGTFTVKSGATIKTAGTVTGTGTTNVEQALASGRSWWYLASPVSSATSNVIAPTSSTNKIGEYFENYIETPTDNASTTAPYYSLPFTAGSAKALTVGKGYVIKFSDTNAKTVTFTGGSLNTGDVSPSVTRTGTTAAKRGFNLVGNPYPSYLDWNLVFDAATATNMRNAIWFRTMGTSAMTFQTYSDGEGVPDNASSIIAPMQAFWVKVDKDNTAASLTFKNTHRSHFVTGANPLKVKALDARPRLRLVVSNGTTTDELLVVGKSYASDVLDSYDIEKFSNDNVAIPEIYSVVSGQELVINSMNELTEGKTVTLGFRPGQAGTFTIETTQLENIDAKVVLVDKVAVKEQELTAETPYTFVSDETPTNDRFLIKLVSKVPTGVENTAATGDLTVYVNRNNRIQLICGIELNDQATVSVYNVAGQKLSTQKLSKSATELNGTYNPGVYMIQLTNGSQAITKKLIIR